MRKIVIITSFAESHLLKCLIPNLIETLNPDKIIISEGLMKNGPENKKELDSEFRNKWCYQGTNAGFDWEETAKICQEYPNLVDFGWNWYEMESAVEAYRHSIKSFGEDSKPEIGDLIYCMEADSFLLESDREIIEEECSRLNPGQGLAIKYVDFLETQFYTEKINMNNPKYRRFVYKFDNMEKFLTAMSEGFMTQNYPRLKKTDSFFSRHYNWFRPGKYRQLRYDLIWRKDPQYWQDFESGLQEIQAESEDYVSGKLEGDPAKQIIIRPSRNDDGRFAKFVNIDHPIHIQSHENFIK